MLLVPHWLAVVVRRGRAGDTDPTACLRRLWSKPRMLGVRLCRNNISGTKVMPVRSARCLPISADWLKLRDHIRVQCNGTGVMMTWPVSSGTWRSNCCAMTRAKPILPPYFNRSATRADRSSYFTAARMPSCQMGLRIPDTKVAP